MQEPSKSQAPIALIDESAGIRKRIEENLAACDLANMRRDRGMFMRALQNLDGYTCIMKDEEFEDDFNEILDGELWEIPERVQRRVIQFTHLHAARACYAGLLDRAGMGVKSSGFDPTEHRRHKAESDLDKLCRGDGMSQDAEVFA